MLFPVVAYTWLQPRSALPGAGTTSAAYHRQTTRKGIFATLLYLAGVPLTFVTPWLGIACAAIVAIFWFLPRSPLNSLFGD